MRKAELLTAAMMAFLFVSPLTAQTNILPVSCEMASVSCDSCVSECDGCSSCNGGICPLSDCLSGWEVSGWLNGGFIWNTDDPTSNFNGPYNGVDRANEGMLNQAYLVIEKALPKCGHGLGGRVDFLYRVSHEHFLDFDYVALGHLHHTAQALKVVAEGEAQAKRELEEHKEHLEELVEQRTSQLKQANRRLNEEVLNHAKARKQAEQASRAKSAFLASQTPEQYAEFLGCLSLRESVAGSCGEWLRCADPRCSHNAWLCC